MIEGLLSLVASIVEFTISLFVSLIEFVAGFFVAAGETLTAIDLFLLLFVLLVELVVWGLLWFKELLFSLIGWRKPKAVVKPVFWRPKPKEIKSS